MRNSTGKLVTKTLPSLSVSEGKRLPHHLGASTSSCHDFCKYGRKHAFEMNGEHPTFSKISRNNKSPEEEQNQGSTSNLGPRQKKSVVKLKPPVLYPKIELSDSPITIEEAALSPPRTIISAQDFEIIKQRSPYPVGSSEEHEFIKFNAPSNFEKVESPYEPETIKLNTPLPLKKVEPPDEPETIKQNNTPVEKIGFCEDPELTMQMTTQFIKKTEPSVNREIARQKVSVKKAPLSEKCETSERKKRPVRTPTSFPNSKINMKAPSSVENSASVKPKVKQTSLFAKVDASAKPVFSGMTRILAAKSVSSKNLSAVVIGRKDRESNAVKSVFTEPKVLQTSSLFAKTNVASAKPVFSGKTRLLAVKSVPSKNLSAGVTGRKNRESNVVKSVGQPKLGEKKVLRPPSAPLAPQPPVERAPNLKLRKYVTTQAASRLKNQSKVGKAELGNDNMKEKTLYIIEPKPEKERSSQSLHLKGTKYQSSLLHYSVSNHEEEEEEHGSSESTLSEASSSAYEHEGKKINQVEISKGEDRMILRGPTVVHPKDKDPTPHKLKFRRGKVVDPQSESNGPRRLRFRQGKRTGENQNGGEAVRRSFRRRRELVGGDSNYLDPEAQTVALKHQDMLDKKDTQGLFNHVIEETASKLVETRKSKVKALVGAFETVISLQESKTAVSV